MSPQADYVVANASGSAFRADLNNQLAAIVANNSGATEPATMYAFQWWADTTTSTLKLRNASNNAWVTIGTLASTNLGLLSLAGGTMTGALVAALGTSSVPGISFTGDLDTGLSAAAANTLVLSTNGTARLTASTTAVTSSLPIDVPLGSVGAPSLTFTGDLDTGILSPGANQLAIATNGVERVEFGTTEVVFNDGGADVDFRVEGDTNADLFKIDAGLDQVQVANLNGGPLAGFRNRIINGNFDIAQRGTSFAAIASAAYSLDRWAFGYAGAMVCTVTQSTDVPNNTFQSSYKVDVTTVDSSIAAGDYAFISQRIEGYNVRDLIGTTFTVSFWVKSSKTGLHCVSFSNSGQNRSYIKEYTVAAVNTWEYKTVTVTGGLITAGTWTWTNGEGLEVGFALATGSTFQTTSDAWQTGDFLGTASQVNVMDNTANDFFLTGVQLEPGAVATPFEQRPIGTELALCQRYFETSYPAGTAVGAASDATGSLMNVATNISDFYSYGSFRFAVKKRTSPTITTYNPVTGTAGQFRGISDSSNAATIIVGFVNDSGVGRVACGSVNMTTSFVYALHYAASAEL